MIMPVRLEPEPLNHNRGVPLTLATIALFAVFLGSALSGCSANATIGGTPASVSDSSGAPSSATVTARQAAAVGDAFNVATVEPQVLFDRDGLKVTLTSLDTAAGLDVALAITVDNATEVPVTVFPTFTAVNGYMVYANDAIEAKAGESVDGYFTLVGESLRDMGICDIAQIQLCVGVAGGSAYSASQNDAPHGTVANGAQKAYASDSVTIRTSLYDQVDLTPVDVGELVWSGGGLRVSQIEFVQDKSLGVAALSLWVINETSEPALFQYSIAGINGLSVRGYYSEQLAPGARCKTYIFVDDAMANANIGDQDVSSIDVTFTVIGFDGQNKAESDLIHIDVE